MVGHVLGLPERGDSSLEIAGVPQDDGGHQQIEAASAVLLVLVGPVAYFTEAMDEHAA